ncbi:site-specific integrase [Polyangium sp. 15x6]|uniref:tyrosine-type recombinase/integrase n=1 Tax=Polyangium sp. 15x6 TaxID=3042687 RepID=UPI00249BD3C3|nr:site-specific integrase [Polyangium sp. 15x6]MDI3284723.1 site-specific integrase [Polyangium sp. 15x6]
MTVRKKTRRGKLRWIIEIPYRDRRTGKRVRFRRDAQVQTSQAAHSEERRLIAQLEELGYIPAVPGQQDGPVEPVAPPPASPQSFTFREAVELFRATKAITKLKRTTRRSYEVSFESELLPRFADMPAAEVDFVKVTKLDADLVKAGLEPSSRRNIQVALRSVLRCAVEAGQLAAMPKLPKLPKVGQKVVQPPSVEDVELVLGLAYSAARMALTLAADAGLRAGEIRGLRWMDVDLDAGLLIVRQTIYGGEVDTPKSGHERTLPLTTRLARMLREAAAKPHEPTDPVSPSSRGTVWGESSLLHAFQRVLAKAKLPKSRLHDLRHFFVTRCFRIGADAPTVQALAGHQHLSVTQRYAHTNEVAKRGVIERLSLAS